MIFEMNTSFDINTDSVELRVWRGRYSMSWTRSTGRKNSERLNDISSRNEVRASRYLTLKNNKIT